MDNYLEKGTNLIIADVLSVFTIASSFVLKIPQIQKIRNTHQAAGISLLGLCLELFSYTVMMSYNYKSQYAFLTYMEYPVLLIQEYILIFFVYKYKNMNHQKTIMTFCAYIGFVLAIYTEFLPSSVLTILVPLCTPIGASSKLLQVFAIVSTKNSSSVSLATWFLSAFTNLTRIYTVLIVSQDAMLLFNFVVSFLLSTTVLIAAAVYKNVKLYKD